LLGLIILPLEYLENTLDDIKEKADRAIKDQNS
jgi:hypothetical protein